MCVERERLLTAYRQALGGLKVYPGDAGKAIDRAASARVNLWNHMDRHHCWTSAACCSPPLSLVSAGVAFVGRGEVGAVRVKGETSSRGLKVSCLLTCMRRKEGTTF